MTDPLTRARKKYEKACKALADKDDDVQQWLSQVARLQSEKDSIIRRANDQIAALKNGKAKCSQAIDEEVANLYAQIKQRVWQEYNERPEIKPLYEAMEAIRAEQAVA
jgi:predicted  nucleic acid-binding Zn-ribbon protein